MKKIFLLAGLALSLGIAPADAQVRINVNIGAPVMGQSWYNNNYDYYYMPDQGVYYNVSRRVYVWPGGGGWMCGPSLPASYGACTWGNSRYHAFRGRAPFMRHDFYRDRYGNGGRRGAYAYRNDRGFDGGRGNGWHDGGRWNEGRRDGGRGGRGYENGGGRRWNNDRGGDRNWNNNGNGGGNNNGGGYNGNGGGNGGGRGGWDRR